jgi:hypothetical protein
VRAFSRDGELLLRQRASTDILLMSACLLRHVRRGEKSNESRGMAHGVKAHKTLDIPSYERI